MNHLCYAVDKTVRCKKLLSEEILLCPKHWRRVSLASQRRVTAAWKDLNGEHDLDRDEAGERYMAWKRARDAAVAEASR